MNRIAVLTSEENDLYSGFNEYPSAFDVRELETDEIFREALLQSSHGRRNVFKPGTSYRTSNALQHGISSSIGFAAGRLQTASRLSTGARLGTTAAQPAGLTTGRLQTAAQDDQVRPMTAVRGAGYTSARPTTAMFDPMNPKISGLPGSGSGLKEETPEEKVKRMEKQLMALIEESCVLESKGQRRQALEKAKEASSKEKNVIRLQEQSGLSESHNLDLTFLVLFNLANQYSSNDMHTEALNTYQVITKNKMFANASRLKLNMGNIYFRLGEFSKALKMYRMAIDQVPSSYKSFRAKILHNIARVFVQTGEMEQACQSLESIMQEVPNFGDGAQLVACSHMLGDVEKMKRCFQLLLTTPSSYDEEKYSSAAHEDVESQLFLEAIKNDELRAWEKKELELMERSIISSVKLIAPAIEDNYSSGYDWCLEAVKASRHAHIAGDLDLDKAVMLLRSRQLSAASDLLLSFQDRDPKVASCAANNLSLVHYLSNELDEAETWAERAKDVDSYNAAAFVNLGNVALAKHNAEQAKECYQIAYENDSTCVEALYNLGLACKMMGEYEQSLSHMIKLDTITRHDPRVLYQLGRLSELIGDNDQASEWYLQLLGIMPSDPGVLHRMGVLMQRQGDQHQAFQYHYDSYKHYPCDLEVIDWIAGHYMSLGVPEKALNFLKKAAMVAPTEIKWQLLMAACYKRSGKHMKALDIYKSLHKEHPDNIECLQLLVSLSSELGMREASDYTLELRRAEKAKEVRERIGSSRPGSRKSTGSGSRSSGLSPSLPFNQARSSSNPGSAASVGKMSQLRRGNSALMESEEFYAIQESPGMPYDDPLGPLPERPRTSMGKKVNDFFDFGSEELGDDLLPE